MQNPGFVTLNNHRIKVQRWQDEPGVLSFSTIVRGEHLGRDVVAEVQRGTVTLIVGEHTFTGTARITDHRVTGAGPTAVHRIEIRMDTDTGAIDATEPTADAKLDLILAELRALRREIAILRGERASGQASMLPPGTGTLLDFEIPIDDEDA